MRSKSSFKRITKVLAGVNNFTNNWARKNFLKFGMFIFCRRSTIVDQQQISAPQIADGDHFSIGELQKWYIFSVWSRHFWQGGAAATPLKSASLWGSCCLKTTLVVFVAKNCWFYQNLEKIGTTNEIWLMKRWGGRYFDRNFCQRLPHLYVANL